MIISEHLIEDVTTTENTDQKNLVDEGLLYKLYIFIIRISINVEIETLTQRLIVHL
jgi:hypothetical protein